MRVLADARRIPVRDGCVQCVVTSPPYWGLRDYGVPGQIGLERTPEAYVQTLVQVFREVRRVLADDGVLWLNLGDCYANDGKWGGETGGLHSYLDDNSRKRVGREKRITGLKPKDLVGIPWRVAFALQADGWYLRSDVIWGKPNPIPESVTDRPTKAHEYVFLLTKSERYYYNGDAIAEPASDALAEQLRTGYAGQARKDYAGAGVQNPSDVKARILASKRRTVRAGVDVKGGGQGSGVMTYDPLTRNARSVWVIPTQPYHGAHFATMPERLAERCIRAGSRPDDLVLDPFGGSGTTVRVARRLNRRGVMLDLNPAYLDLARERTSQVQVSLLEAEQTA